MRWAVVAVWLASATARADEPAALVTEGRALAKSGQFKAAIAKFKAAHAAAPTQAEPECLTALGYRRIERWGQAQLFLARCRALADTPEWVAQLATEIEDGTARGGLVPVTFAVVAPGAVTVSVASFAPDEAFPPQLVYLEPGPQHLTLATAGQPPREVALQLVAGTPFTVRAELAARSTPVGPVAAAPAVPAAPDRRLAKVVAGVGGGLLVASVVAHAIAASTRSDTQQSLQAFTAHIDAFKTQRTIALTGYALTALVAGVDAWLWTRTPEVAGGHVGPTVTRGGAGLDWTHAW